MRVWPARLLAMFPPSHYNNVTSHPTGGASRAGHGGLAAIATVPQWHPALQNRLMSLGGLKLMGCDSGVAVKSSFHILMVLSASHVTSLDPVLSKDMA